jgi:hypothetical protein
MALDEIHVESVRPRPLTKTPRRYLHSVRRLTAAATGRLRQRRRRGSLQKNGPLKKIEELLELRRSAAAKRVFRVHPRGTASRHVARDEHHDSRQQRNYCKTSAGCWRLRRTKHPGAGGRDRQANRESGERGHQTLSDNETRDPVAGGICVLPLPQGVDRIHVRGPPRWHAAGGDRDDSDERQRAADRQGIAGRYAVH